MKLKVLFVCSRNQWRSPTAENIYRRSQVISVRSAGTSASARRRITERDLQWADRVFVMETHHRDAIRKRFVGLARELSIEVLGIPDDYQFMDDQLAAELEAKVTALIPELGNE